MMAVGGTLETVSRTAPSVLFSGDDPSYTTDSPIGQRESDTKRRGRISTVYNLYVQRGCRKDP
jgi:hypothetical protein